MELSLILITGFFFSVAYSNELFIQLTKLASTSENIYKQGFYVSRVQIYNRFAAPIFLFSLAYFIDTNGEIGAVNQLIFALLLIKLLFTLLVLAFYKFLVREINPKFVLIYRLTDWRMFFLTFIANSSVFIGALLPLILSDFLKGYNASIMQSGIFFNSIGTMLNLLWIDKILGDYSERFSLKMGTDENTLGRVGFTLIIARLYSLVFIIICYYCLQFLV